VCLRIFKNISNAYRKLQNRRNILKIILCKEKKLILSKTFNFRFSIIFFPQHIKMLGIFDIDSPKVPTISDLKIEVLFKK